MTKKKMFYNIDAFQLFFIHHYVTDNYYLMEVFTAFLINIGQAWNRSPGANSLAYFTATLVTKVL